MKTPNKVKKIKDFQTFDKSKAVEYLKKKGKNCECWMIGAYVGEIGSCNGCVVKALKLQSKQTAEEIFEYLEYSGKVNNKSKWHIHEKEFREVKKKYGVK